MGNDRKCGSAGGERKVGGDIENDMTGSGDC